MTLEITRPWARVAATAATTAATTVSGAANARGMGSGTGGGFFTVRNPGREADRLISASTSAAERVEIHAIKVVGPDIRMRPLENGLAVPPQSTITLKPRGYHLLMRGLETPLAVGARVRVTLTFEKAGTREIELVVEAPGPVGDDVLAQDPQPE